MSFRSDYLPLLCSHLAAVLPTVEHCPMTGCVRNPLTDDMDLWATPGWEDLPGLPWSVESDGDLAAHGTEPVEWTGDPEQDTALYQGAVARITARLRAALARGAAYHRIHWTDAAWALDVGVRSDGTEEPIPGVVRSGQWVFVHSMFLDEPHLWPVATLIVEVSDA